MKRMFRKFSQRIDPTCLGQSKVLERSAVVEAVEGRGQKEDGVVWREVVLRGGKL